ncbi:MAG: class I SAM-dependent methyltransferase [Acidobacteriota bacterium]
MADLRTVLFEKYKLVHGDFVANRPDRWQERLDWFRNLYRKNYASRLKHPGVRLLEVGCNQGFFLKILSEHGFEHLYGIDLSPDDVDLARTRFGLRNVFVADAQEYLSRAHQQFDVIFAKDVLEHIESHRLQAFIGAVFDCLTPEGVAIFQVPNMDWVASSHERHMDLTHSLGFTRESLGQLLRLHFDDVTIDKVYSLYPQTWKQRLLWGPVRRCYLKLYRLHLTVIGEGAADTWFDCREIMAVCRKACSR